MLASLINYRPNRKKIPSKSPFSLRRPDPSSPHPYAPHVFDIGGESSFEEPEPDPASSVAHYEPEPPHPLPEPVISPRVDVNIEFTPGDWFPSHFLKTDSIAGPSGLAGAASAIATSANARKSEDTFQTTDTTSEGEDDETSSTSEDVVSNLQALDASDFVNVPTSDGLMPQSTAIPSLMAARKGAPSPIRIPNATLHGPRVQIVRSSTVPSRPESMYTLDGASAVSGTTLARALIGDSFVLSTDRSSRYRSGASVLTRSDSATLPRGEHPFSPAWTIRKSGAITPDSFIGIDSMGFPIPPVPPMPENLRQAIAAETRDRQKIDDVAPKWSRRRSNSDAETPVSPLVRTNSGSKILGEDARRSRRVSRISEIATPPVTPEVPSGPDSAAFLSPAPSDTQNFNNGLSPSTFPTSPGQSSTSNTRSSQDLDNVLDYYNFEPSPGYADGSSSFDLPSPDVPADTNRYQPVFTPITEESGSQLSPNSFRSRGTPSGKMSLASTPSPLTGSGRVDWRPSEIRSLPAHPLLPIGDRPRSIPTVPPPIVIPPPPPILYSTNVDGALEPPSRSIFNRQRSGSAPSPIMVVRDSHDITHAYNITVSPRVGTSSAGSTPATADGDNVLVQQQQTFPETPSAFSPMFSPGSASPDARHSMMPPPLPSTGGPRPGFSSLAQKVLLTRAATSVRGARHSRQASLTRARNRSTAVYPSAQTAILLKEALQEDVEVVKEEAEPVEVSAAPQEKEDKLVVETTARPREKEEKPQPEPLLPASTPDVESPADSASMYTPSIGSFPSPPSNNRSLHRLSQSSDSNWHSMHDGASQEYHRKPLPAMPVSPTSPAESEKMPASEPAVEVAEPKPVAEVVQPIRSASSSSLPRPAGPTPSTSPQPPEVPSRRSSFRSSPSPAPPEPTEAPAPVPQPPATPPSPVREVVAPPAFHPHRPPLLLTPPPPPLDPTLGSPHIVPLFTPHPGGGESPLRSSFGSIGSPPPYYTVMYDREDSSGRENERMTPSTGGSGSYPDHFSPSTPSMHLREQRSLSTQSVASPGRRPRARPPLPIGPRRPSASAATATQGGRNRNGSVSSIASNMPTGRRLVSSSPRFQTPPLKWRGYTMDAAKWTFSSAQLQGIVSRAIRQSAEASSIRLLRLETVDTDIPEELHRLDMQRTDVKTRWTSLCDVHSASALAMALRKLNASFLKQIAEAAALRTQVESLQAERDEAWSQAVDVANDYDDLNGRIEMGSPGPSSYNKRSSRVLASRRSSIRVSKAGLRSSSRRSSVSNFSAQRASSSSGLPSATMEDIPPVPPIPRHRPQDIMTDLPSRTSARNAMLATLGMIND
ncbi:hypothetical protein B0H10DRAFT_1952060 [Mycena sp. CBHHK59/15]|nr:hypothetical protein B0H10DRAFT_1952060 [Mycena sp. CBHHK59/15]